MVRIFVAAGAVLVLTGVDRGLLDDHGLTQNDSPRIDLDGSEFFGFSGLENPIVLSVRSGEYRSVFSPRPIAAEEAGSFTFEHASGGIGPAAFLSYTITEYPGDFRTVKTGCFGGSPTSRRKRCE